MNMRENPDLVRKYPVVGYWVGPGGHRTICYRKLPWYLHAYVRGHYAAHTFDEIPGRHDVRESLDFVDDAKISHDADFNLLMDKDGKYSCGRALR